MRRWQTWFFRPSVQIPLWVLVFVAGWTIVNGTWDRPRLAFEHSAPGMASPRDTSTALEGWTSVAKAAMPAVVNIATSRMTPGQRSGPLPNDPFFRFFFGDPGARPRREQSLGSGVIVTRDGYVLTNNHVVEGAQDIRVTLADRRELKGTLVGADPKTDLAVLKLAGSGLPAMPIGEGRVEVAEVVLAIGSPFGLSQTVTQGIVSAVGRANLGIADYEDFIQTDAAINPGNSGGALVNARGELIGINTAIVSESGGYAGIGFAVPTIMAKQVMEHVVKRGRVTRGYLGVGVQEATPVVVRALGVSNARGVLVADVASDGPATRAGLKRGDLITAIDDKAVDDVGHFRNLIAGTPPGSKVRVKVVRDGSREQTLEVDVGELPADRGPVPASARAPASGTLGLGILDMTPEINRKLALPPGTQGVVVAEVAPGGRAAEAGLRPGDVIQELNRQPIRSAQDFSRALQYANGRDVLVLVNRGGNAAYVAIERT